MIAKLGETTFYDLSIAENLPALSGRFWASQRYFTFCSGFTAVLRGCVVYHCFAWYFIVRDLAEWVQSGTQRTARHRVAHGRARIAHYETIVQPLYCSVLFLCNRVQFSAMRGHCFSLC